uniref:Prolamin-like domain-containing protein n=1 Tax=Oryza punctata TaxID=4537 RepID=A0A0E0KCI3_ORYPU
MACSGHLLPVLLSLLLAGAGAGTAAAVAAGAPPGFGLAQRLADGVGPQQQQQCWEVLMEIKSCTGEIILFFINGEAYLGPGCCRAIRVIEQSCWATDAMLSVIGFTPEEGDMLKGYCDAGDEHKPSPPPASPAVGYVAVGENAAAASAPAGRKNLALQHR